MTDWIDDEFERAREDAGGEEESLQPAAVAHAIETWWGRLVAGVHEDVERFRDHNVWAEIEEPASHHLRVRYPDADLVLDIVLDSDARNVRFDYISTKQLETLVQAGDPRQPRMLAPEGGILSLRPRRYGVAVFSSDQQLSDEQTRRTLLQPLLFPQKPSEEAA